MEQNEISIHEVEVWRVMQANPARWMSNSEIYDQCRPALIRPRTVRAKTIKLVTLGLLDQAEVFPAHRYRLSSKARQRNAAYLMRLEKAGEVFSEYLSSLTP